MLFGRIVRVTIGPSGGSGRLWESRPGVPGPRIRFSVDRDSAREPNAARIEIYNLGPDSRNWIQSGSGYSVILEAGHDGQPGMLFNGDIARTRSVRVGTEWVTKIEGGDGEAAFRGATVSVTFPAGTAYTTIFHALAGAFGVVLGYVSPLAPLSLKRAATLVGPVRDRMDEIVGDLGLSWSIQDGELQVLGPDQVIAGTGELISATAGLIGNPEPVNEDDSAGVKFICLLNPRIRPRVAVSLQSSGFSGFYAVDTVKHEGDSGFDSAFSTTVEATEFSQ